jgi:hypothetical protein
LRHVAGPQPEARQEQDDRAITPARNDFAIACGDQPVHLLCHQIPRQVGKPPMGIARNDISQTCTARSKPAPRHARNRRLKTLETGTASRSNPASQHAANRHLITA